MSRIWLNTCQDSWSSQCNRINPDSTSSIKSNQIGWYHQTPHLTAARVVLRRRRYPRPVVYLRSLILCFSHLLSRQAPQAGRWAMLTVGVSLLSRCITWWSSWRGRKAFLSNPLVNSLLRLSNCHPRLELPYKTIHLTYARILQRSSLLVPDLLRFRRALSWIVTYISAWRQIPIRALRHLRFGWGINSPSVWQVVSALDTWLISQSGNGCW